MGARICCICGEGKLERLFNWKVKAKGIRQPACKECQSKKNKAYRKTNSEKIKSKNKRYYRLNKEKLLKYGKKRYEQNRPSILEQKRRYYQLNAKEIREKHKSYLEKTNYNQKYYQKNKAKILKDKRAYRKENQHSISAYNKHYNSTLEGRVVKKRLCAKRRDLRKKIDSVWDLKHEERMWSKYGHKCFSCGDDSDLHIDHLFPLSWGYPLNNLNAVPMCGTCNMQKSARDPYEFLDSDKITKRFKVSDFEVNRIKDDEDYHTLVRAFHYTQTSTRARYRYGLYLYGDLVGACLFGNPSRQTIKADLELNRFFIFDGTPKNTASFFLGRSLKLLAKDGFKGKIITFSDPTEGHSGSIYKATNWQFIGYTSKNYHYETEDGLRVHKRQVWNRAKANGRKEPEQANLEGLKKVEELPKYKFEYSII